MKIKITKSLLSKIDGTEWTLTEGSGYHDGHSPYKADDEKRNWIKAAHKDGNIELILNVIDCKGNDTYGHEGSTRFKNTDGGWSTFDRRGVESSFTMGGKYCGYKSFDEAIVGETKRVEDHLGRIAAQGGYVDVPSTGFRITQATKKQHIEQLAKGECVRLFPSGFGTGYLISKKRISKTKCRSELCKFYGLDTLYIVEQDCD